MQTIDVEAVKKFIDAQSIDTRIYLGCDSERVKLHNGWWADYTLAVVVHINGNSGCKIFGQRLIQRRAFQLQWIFITGLFIQY